MLVRVGGSTQSLGLSVHLGMGGRCKQVFLLHCGFVARFGFICLHVRCARSLNGVLPGLSMRSGALRLLPAPDPAA